MNASRRLKIGKRPLRIADLILSKDR